MHASAAIKYPRPIAGRLDTDAVYDLVLIEDLGGAVAVRADDHVSASVVRAARRAGYVARPGAIRVPAAQLPRVAPRLLWVNPTAADLLRLRWNSWPEDSRGLERSRSGHPNGKAIRGTEGPHRGSFAERDHTARLKGLPPPPVGPLRRWVA